MYLNHWLNVLISFGLTTAAALTNGEIHQKINDMGMGITTLILSDKEMQDIMKIVNSHEECGLLRKGESIENKECWSF